MTVLIEEYRKLSVFILKIKGLCVKHNEKHHMFLSHMTVVGNAASSSTTKNPNIYILLKT